MTHDIFVSYSHKDKNVADAVVTSLEDKGFRCWFAPRDVTPGTSWGNAIVRAIEESRIMVMILSENSNKSRQVVREVERAVSKEVVIIPFRIENVDPTGALAYFLSTEHWLDALTPPLEKHIDKLGNTIQVFLTGNASLIIDERLKEDVSIPPKRSRRLWQTLIPIILICIAVLVLLSVVVIPRLSREGHPNATEILHSTATLVKTFTPTPTVTLIKTYPPSTPTPPPAFTLIGEYETSASTNGLFFANNILYVANGHEGLLRLNVASPENPRPMDIYLVDDAQRIVVDDEVVFVISGDDNRQLVIMELGADGITNTFQPEAISLYYLTVADGLAHLTGHNYWGIIDLHNPMLPKELWSWSPWPNSALPCNVVVDGNIAYIGGGVTGLHIFDFTDPQNPELVGQFETSNAIIGMAVADEVLYFTTGEGGLLSFDVSDPARPFLLDQLNLPGSAMYISTAGDRLYVVYRLSKNNTVIESGVVAIDVRDPEALTSIAVYDKLSFASDIQTVDDVIFVADRNLGIVILEFGFEK